MRGVRVVSPHENDQQEGKERERGGMRVEEEMFDTVFGQSVEDR